MPFEGNCSFESLRNAGFCRFYWTGWKMDKETYYQMLDAYYALHGGDRKTGLPKRETLLDLGLKYVARDLEKIGKIRSFAICSRSGIAGSVKKGWRGFP